MMVLPTTAWAQTTGRLEGWIVDAQALEPIGGATVVVEGTLLGTATSRNGEYFVDHVPTGTYTVRMSFVGYPLALFPDVEITGGIATSLDVAMPENLVPGDFVSEFTIDEIRGDSAGTLSGTVSDATTNEPIPGAIVTLGPVTFTSRTDAAGAFELENIDFDTHDFSVKADGFQAVVYKRFSLFALLSQRTVNLVLNRLPTGK